MAPATERRDAEPSRQEMQAARRRLMLRDGLLFLSLTAVALVLAGVTTLLFRSFEAHRETLAEDAAARGRMALQQGRPADAVEDFRSALEYRRGDREDQLAMAKALAASGRLQQAESYFLTLWQTQPGDGSINLELARLKRQQGQVLDAIQYYRAAVFGTWTGDAPRRRRDIRLELSAYLISIGQARAARAELLIASGNNPDAATQYRIAELLDAAGDANDALVDYRNASSDTVTGADAQRKLADLCYRMGQYGCAEQTAATWLQHGRGSAELREHMTAMKHDAERIQGMSLSSALSATERARHLRLDADVVRARMTACAATQPSAEVSALQAQWKAFDTAKSRSALPHDDALAEQYRTTIFRTENALTAACGAASGDDALLLYLEAHPAVSSGAQP